MSLILLGLPAKCWQPMGGGWGWGHGNICCSHGWHLEILYYYDWPPDDQNQFPRRKCLLWVWFHGIISYPGLSLLKPCPPQTPPPESLGISPSLPRTGNLTDSTNLELMSLCRYNALKLLQNLMHQNEYLPSLPPCFSTEWEIFHHSKRPGILTFSRSNFMHSCGYLVWLNRFKGSCHQTVCWMISPVYHNLRTDSEPNLIVIKHLYNN